MKTVLLHDQPLSGNGKHTTGAKRFGRGRIAGLILIAVLTLGLGYLHFAGGSASVSVPAGAHAGQLTLKHCTYGRTWTSPLPSGSPPTTTSCSSATAASTAPHASTAPR